MNTLENLKGKQLDLRLVGIDGNAFSLMGAFRQQAKKENWTKQEIDLVIEEAMSSNYSHLLSTLTQFTKD